MEDVGATRSYDLHCVDEVGRTFQVEVKGTTGPLGEIVLTANEVNVALSEHPHTALFVVHGIDLHETPDQPTASGGEIHNERPWLPDLEFLVPSVYCLLGR